MSEIDQYTKLLLHANGDLSPSHHNLTYNGGVKLDYVATPVGSGAYYFDGNDDYISVPDSTDFDFGSGDFCIELFAKASSWTSHELVSRYSDTDSSKRAWVLFSQSDGDLDFAYHNGSTVVEHVVLWGQPTGEFVHIAITRNGSDLKTFIDGIQAGTTHNIGTTVIKSISDPLHIGSRQNGTNYLDGHIADLQITKGEAKYTSNFTPPTTRAQPDANTVLLLSGSGDYGTTGHSITTYNGVKESSDSYKFGSGAFYFDGTNDYLSIAHHEDFNLTASDFTIDGWFNCEALTASSQQIISKDGVAYLSFPQYEMTINSTGKLNIRLGTGNGTGDVEEYVGTTTITLNTWNHTALVVSGTNVYLFLNGQLEASGLVPTMIDGGKPVLIGYQTEQPTETYFNGYIDELRVSKGIARWTSDFDVPTSEYGTFVASGTTDSLIFTSYGISEPKPKLGVNFSDIITFCKFDKIYEGQYLSSGTKNYIFGNAKEENDSYFISFYADQERQNKIFEYETNETFGHSILITGSGVGGGASGYFSYDLGI